MPDSQASPPPPERTALAARLGKIISRKPASAAPSGGQTANAGSRAGGPPPRPDGWRETIESIVVAFVLAFLFRTFEAEAFVIPTGSMAPTLFGQQRDIHCERCGMRFAVGVSSLPAGDAEVRFDRNGPFLSSSDRSHFAVCPNANCRFPNYVLDREMFAGDRILVNKFPYEFSDPERFDVVVFKFPEGAKTNYIKRLVGLPGEEVLLEGGDVKVRKLDSNDDTFRIARKPPEKQRKLQLLVHDNDHPARELLAAGWPEAWAPEDGSNWSADAEARTFRVDPDPQGKVQWLRYTNYVPSADVWTRVLDGKQIVAAPQPQEVRDFYAYNARITARESENAVASGRLPDLASRDIATESVGDLTLSCTVNVLAPQGALTLELVEGARAYHAVIDLKTGQGSLHYRHEMSREDEKLQPAGDSFDTPMKSTGSYDVSFANVDDRLCLWIDDVLVKSLEFEEGSRYAPQRQPISVTERDKAPTGIAAAGAKLQVSHLLIERDIYYTNEPYQSNSGGRYVLNDREDDAEDEFLMLGDNSPRSNDSRMWTRSHAVPRRLLIGKAFYIYWPHGVPFLGGGRGFALGNYHEREGGPNAKVTVPKYSAPFYPQIGRMKRIR
jgi:signal peptidase I